MGWSTKRGNLKSVPPNQTQKTRNENEIQDTKTKESTVEIVAFYQYKDPKTNVYSKDQGSLHVYWINKNLDIRGINIQIKSLNTFFIYMPGNKVLDDNGEKVHYPIIDSPDRAEIRGFVKAIKKEFKEFLKTYKFL